MHLTSSSCTLFFSRKQRALQLRRSGEPLRVVGRPRRKSVTYATQVFIPVSHYRGTPADHPNLCCNSRVILRESSGDSLYCDPGLTTAQEERREDSSFLDRAGRGAASLKPFQTNLCTPGETTTGQAGNKRPSSSSHSHALGRIFISISPKFKTHSHFTNANNTRNSH